MELLDALEAEKLMKQKWKQAGHPVLFHFTTFPVGWWLAKDRTQLN